MKYILFDSNYFCWRAFHTPAGNLSYEDFGTGIIHSFLVQVLIHSRNFGLTFPVFFWDSKKKIRKQIYAGYKDRQQEEMTDDEKEARKELFHQMEILRTEILPAIGFKNNFIQTGYEADDLIAKFVIDNPNQSVVLTNDEDLLQLVDYCSWYSPSKQLLINGKEFRKKYGIEPKQWRDVKALAGCSSDKVPGISGIGEKYAIQYLKNEMKSDSIRYNKIESTKGRWLRKRNEKLVSLPYPGTEEIKLKENKFSIDSFLEVCKTYGMHHLAAQASEWQNHFRIGYGL